MSLKEFILDYCKRNDISGTEKNLIGFFLMAVHDNDFQRTETCVKKLKQEYEVM